MWVENDKPREGIIANLMRKAKSEYKRAVKNIKGAIKRNQSSIRAEKMADAILQNNTRSFWSEVRRSIGKGRAVPTVIDQAETDVEISNIFVDKYKELYTSVPYDTESMNILKKQLSDNVASKCCNGLCDTSHNITTQDVINAIAKLKPYKVDGKFETYSDNLINASPNLYVHLSILFTCMLTHNIVPDDMLLATLVPIPKSRKKSLSDSNKALIITGQLL